MELLFGGLIGASILLFYFSKITYKFEQIQKINQWFGEVLFVQRKTSYWQKYLTRLENESARAGISFDKNKWEKRIPLIGICLLLLLILFGVPWWMALVLTILMGLLPRVILREVSNRFVIRFRKDLMKEVIPLGIHALSGAGGLRQACLEIEHSSHSKLIKREFKIINKFGNSPGMTVAEAMMYRAKELNIREFFVLAVATYEGERRRGNLRMIWKETEKVLFRQVSMHNTISAETSMYRIIAIILFIVIYLVILFGYKAFHIHGLLSFGVMITAISAFVGIIQVAKAASVD